MSLFETLTLLEKLALLGTGQLILLGLIEVFAIRFFDHEGHRGEAPASPQTPDQKEPE